MGEGGPRERLEVMVYNMPLKKMVMMKTSINISCLLWLTFAFEYVHIAPLSPGYAWFLEQPELS